MKKVRMKCYFDFGLIEVSTVFFVHYMYYQDLPDFGLVCIIQIQLITVNIECFLCTIYV